LDHTAFYPASGGQPSDRGDLSGVPVVGVEVRQTDGTVVHLLESELPHAHVVGQVDWARRFDHMQQHTGQHLLSAACEQALAAETVSFHMSTEVSTIDLNLARIPPQALESVEESVNRIIWENRVVTSRFVDPEARPGLPLRRPPQAEGPLRLVEVEGFDLTPCGGTHVARTGEIGLLKLLRLDYRGEETRVEFVCGGRALRDYRFKSRIVLRLAASLTVGVEEVEGALGRLQQELKTTRRELRLAREWGLEAEAERLAQTAHYCGPLRVVRAVQEGWASADLRGLAQRLTARPNTVALLAALGERTHLCVACSAEVTVDAAGLLQPICSALNGKGGGQPHLAQGSAPPADRGQVEAALQAVMSDLEPQARCACLAGGG